MTAELPNVVFIHGLGDGRSATFPLSSRMKPHVVDWSVDLLGHGGRPVPSEFSTPAVARDFVEGLDKAGLADPYLFGWSYGGRLALYLARHFPNRFRGVCAFGANFQREQGIRMGLAHYDPKRPRSVPLSDETRTLFALIHSWLADRLNHPPELSEEDLTTIETPVLVLSGTADPLVPVEDAKRLYSLLRNARLVLFPGTAHPDRLIPLDVVRDHFLQFVRDVETVRSQSPETTRTTFQLDDV